MGYGPHAVYNDPHLTKIPVCVCVCACWYVDGSGRFELEHNPTSPYPHVYRGAKGEKSVTEF